MSLVKKFLNYIIKDIVLTKKSSDFFKNNYEIALNSIKKDVMSANYINWNTFSSEKKEALVQELVERGYTLSECSPSYLSKNPKVVLGSITHDINSFKYASIDLAKNFHIFKYLLLNGYNFSNQSLKLFPFSYFLDADVMKHAFKALNIYVSSKKDLVNMKPYQRKIYVERFNQLFEKAFNTFPTIETMKKMFKYFALADWEEHKEDYLENYANLFNKICIELQKNESFAEVQKSLSDLLGHIEDILDDKYELLLNAMRKYHSIIHGNYDLNQIDVSRDTIASLADLYVSKEKKAYLKNRLDIYGTVKHSCFILRKDHPLVYKRVIQNKQKAKFRDLYLQNDPETLKFLENIALSYGTGVGLVGTMIKEFITNGSSKLSSFYRSPRGFNDYQRYKEALKLINRLNSRYIKYSDLEVKRYLDIIKYDHVQKKYIYTGPTIAKERLNGYKEYIRKEKVFEQIKKSIVIKMRSLEVDTNIDRIELEKISKSFPFNDEYYEFDRESLESKFTLGNFVSAFFSKDIIEPNSFISDNGYKLLTDFIINNNLLWILMLSDSHSCSFCIPKEVENKIMIAMDSMSSISETKFSNYNFSNLSDILILAVLTECIEGNLIDILDFKTIEKLAKGLNSVDSIANVFSRAKELTCLMATRNSSTVPYVEGKGKNYNYSMYDSISEDLLVSGVETHSCLRISGVDNDFLYYCALNKNGFIIKISDNFGNVVAKASGFRNGNSVYINQLRTIYDSTIITNQSKSEIEDIIETFKKACVDIVKTSQENKDEIVKIDHVFITKSYVMKYTPSNVSKEVMKKIGKSPLECESENWSNFTRYVPHLRQSRHGRKFSTDYGRYPLICLASIKDAELTIEDIKFGDVEALYKRKRNPIVASVLNYNTFKKIKKIQAIYNYYHPNAEYEVALPEGSYVFVGDNWFIIYYNNEVIGYTAIELDKEALNECNLTLQVLEEVKLSNKKMSVEEIGTQIIKKKS